MTSTTTTTTTTTASEAKIPFVNMGKTGLKVSRICLGCMTFGDPKWSDWVLNEEAALPIIKRALELGVNFFDTANMYSVGESERVLGNCLKKLGVNRHDVIIATKVHFPMGTGPNQKGLSRKAIMHEVEESLKRLQTDYIDLYQIHRFDYETPIEETMEALHDLVKSGKVRYIGASSMHAYQFIQMQQIAKERGWTPFHSMQNHYNLVYREEERDMIPYCKQTGVALLPWSPYAKGFLTGTRGADRKGESIRSQTDKWATVFYTDQNDFEVLEAVKAVAARHSKSCAQISLAWMLQKSHITAPIIGCSKIPQLEEAVSALSIKLTEEDVKQLEDAYKPHKISGHI